MSAASEETNASGALMLDLLIILAATEGERVFSRTLVQALNGRPSRPWAETRRGKPVTEMWLSQKLRPYGLQPRTIWISGEQAKGYYREDLKEVLRRYLPKQEIEALREGIRNA